MPCGRARTRASFCRARFCRARLADDDQILAAYDPVAGGELGEQRLVEPAHGLRVEILHRRVLPQPCELQSADEPLVLALDRFPVDEQGEPLLEGQGSHIRLAPLLFQRLGHAGEAERDEAILRWMREHGWSFLAGPRVGEARRRCGRADDHAIHGCLLSGSSRRRECCRDGAEPRWTSLAGRPCRARSSRSTRRSRRWSHRCRCRADMPPRRAQARSS